MGLSERLERLVETDLAAGDLSPAEQDRQTERWQELLAELLATMAPEHLARLAGETEDDPAIAHLWVVITGKVDAAYHRPASAGRLALPGPVAEVCMADRAYLSIRGPRCRLELPWCRCSELSQDARAFLVFGRYFADCPDCGAQLAGHPADWQRAHGVRVIELP
jgi:hypothetical protein